MGFMLQDLNIGIALWLAASGDGWVCEGPSNNGDNNQCCFRYKSNARIVLVGSGADEQCAGYGRHRTKYKCGRYGISMKLLNCWCCHFFKIACAHACICCQSTKFMFYWL